MIFLSVVFGRYWPLLVGSYAPYVIWKARHDWKFADYARACILTLYRRWVACILGVAIDVTAPAESTAGG